MKPAPQVVESVPQRFRNQKEDVWAEPADIGSDVAFRIEKLKHGVVLDLFLQRGAVWEAIRDVRERWKISPATQVPAGVPFYSLHRPKDGWPDDYAIGERTQPSTDWNIEMHTLARRLVPERYRPSPIDETGWASFLSACVLFDPPETELLPFSELGGPRPMGLSPLHRERGRTFGHPPRAMLAAPIRILQDGLISQFIEGWFWRQVIARIGERHLEPAGLDIHEMMREVLRNSPDLLKRRQERQDQEAPGRYYIAVDEETTEADVRGAFRLISDTLPERSDAGAPQRDPLLAVQCAILHDRHNAPDPADRRRRKWAYERLADEFGELKSSGAAKAHVEAGRQILKENRAQ
jgi:hypothetical protein